MSGAPRSYPWRTFAFLVAAGTLTGPLVLPYFWGLQAIAPNPEPLPPMSTGLLVLLTMPPIRLVRLALVLAGAMATPLAAAAAFSSEADMARELVLPDEYEAVIYVEATTRARPNPPIQS